MSLISEAKMEGKHARRNGIARTDCPPEYSRGRDHSDWLRGWDFAEKLARAEDRRTAERNAA